MKKFIIDRFEGPYVICEIEDQSIVKIPKYKIPLNCKEGDCLVQDAEGMYQQDIDATAAAEKRINNKMNRLFDK